MIHTEPIEALIYTALHTAFIKNNKPQSLLIISQVENGKTKLLSQFRNNPFIAFPHDITAYGIIRDYLPKLESGELKYLMLPEFIQPLSRNQDTVKTLITFLNGLMEDGITELSTFAANIHLKKPVYAGIIACLAIQEFNSHKSAWVKSGFLSRFLPVTYNYSEKSASDIFDGIYKENFNEKEFKINCPETDVKIPEMIARALNPCAREIALKIDQNIKIKGYRAQIQLQRMAKGMALANGRTEVTKEDFDKLDGLLKYVNLDYKEL
jgi:hypothetical protein